MSKRSRTKRRRRSAWERAQAEGLDMSLIEVNLEQTPWERILNHSRALTTATALRQAMEKRHAKP